MPTELIQILKQSISSSDARARKEWAERLVREQIPIESLMSLLHGEEKTAQRFTWFISDLLELDADLVVDCVPMLFALRDQMPFPGMRRTVAKCLWLTNVPVEIEDVAVKQLFEWLSDSKFRIGCKHYSGKALFELAKQRRVSAKKLKQVLKAQTKHSNVAYAGRTKKLLDMLQKH